MLLFCRRMCHQLLLASNCFLSTSFLQTGLSISPRCYCDLLVNCTNHFFLKSVLCSCTKMSHGQRLYISIRFFITCKCSMQNLCVPTSKDCGECSMQSTSIITCENPRRESN